MSRRHSSLSLSRQTNARTVLLRMAEDQDRATRIADLKQQNPRLTWARIAEETGVKERSAIKWQKTGALKPENAERLAELFGVDFDYIWIGPRPGTPDLFVDRRNNAAPADPVAVDRLEGELEQRIARIEDKLNEATSERQAILDLLERQDRLLERIEDAIKREDALRQLLDESAARVDAAVETALRLLPTSESAPQSARRARSKTSS